MVKDFLFAIRALVKNKSITAVAVLSIALGIGANAVMFSLADAILIRPTQVPENWRVLNVRWQHKGQPPGGLSWRDYEDYRDKNQSMEGVTAYVLTRFGFTRDKNVLPEMKAGLEVTGNFFDVLRVKAQLGRTFLPEEDQVAGRDPVAVISHDTWRNEFGASPDVVGRSLFLNGIEFRVIGVAPESFAGVNQFFRPTLYVPMRMSGALSGGGAKDWMEDRGDRRLSVKGRLKAGASAGSGNAEAGVISENLARAYEKTNRDWSGVLRTDLQARTDESPYDAIIAWLLMGLAAVVLLIACANVANLMLGRAMARSGEIAVRMALGAARWRLIRQLLTECVVICVTAGCIGLLMAQGAMSLFLPWHVPSEIPIELAARLDMRVVLYAFCAALVSAALFGLMPALWATGMPIEPALRAGARNLETKGRSLGRRGLVVAQVAGSLLLLVMATQMYEGISYVMRQPPGFRARQMLMASFDPALARYSEDQARRFYVQVAERAGQLPGVKSAALAEVVPMTNHSEAERVVPEGYQLPSNKEFVNVTRNTVSEGYFETMGIPILRGRGFQRTDTEGSTKVAVVNERFAATYYPGQEAVGKRFRIGGSQGDWVEIVGVAKMSKYYAVVEPPEEFFYLPMRQRHQMGMTLLLATEGPSEIALGPLRQMVRDLDPEQPLFGVRTMEEYFSQRGTKTIVVLIALVAGMGVLGFVLALSGLYAVMAWSVARRSREIGIRMALGANSAGVLTMVLKQGLWLSVIGVAIGVALSLGLSRLLTSGMKVPPFDGWMLSAVAALLVLITAAGAFMPARRASLVDPMQVLKEE